MLDSRGSISGMITSEGEVQGRKMFTVSRLIMSSPPHPVMHFGMTGIFVGFP